MAEKGKASSSIKMSLPLEDALDLTGFGKYNYRLFCVCIALLLTMVLQIFGVSFIVTASACELGLTTYTKGVIAAMPMLGVVLSSYLWGWLAYTRGRKEVLIISMLGSSTCSVASSLAPTWPVLAVTKFTTAFFAAAANSVTYALFGECVPRPIRNKMVLLMSCGLMGGQAMLAVVAFPVLLTPFSYPLPGLGINFRPWRVLELVFGLFSCACVIMLVMIVKESPKFYASKGRQQECLKVLSEMFAMNTGKHEREYPVHSIHFDGIVMTDTGIFRSMVNQSAPLFHQPLLPTTLIILYIVLPVYMIAPSLIMWMPTFANHFSRSIQSGNLHDTFCHLINYEDLQATDFRMNITALYIYDCSDKVENMSFVTLIVFSTCLASLNAVNSFMLRVVSKRKLLVFYHLLAGVSGVCLPLIYSSYVGVIMFFLLQINLLCMGLLTSFIVEIYPTYLRAMAVCLSIMVGRGSSFIIVNYIGVLMTNYCEETYYVFGSFIISINSTEDGLVSLLKRLVYLPLQRNDTEKEKLAAWSDCVCRRTIDRINKMIEKKS